VLFQSVNAANGDQGLNSHTSAKPEINSEGKTVAFFSDDRQPAR
jgi:hypothetical protein